MAGTVGHGHNWPRKTYKLLPDVSLRLKIKNLKINFYNLQVLSGGMASFNRIYMDFSLSTTRLCSTCSIDDVKHFVFECSAFFEIRKSYNLASSFHTFLARNKKNHVTLVHWKIYGDISLIYLIGKIIYTLIQPSIPRSSSAWTAWSIRIS